MWRDVACHAQNVPHAEPIDMIKFVNGEIKHLVPPEMRDRTPDLPCGGTVLLHLEDLDESFDDLIRFGKISPDNEATVHKYTYSQITEGRGTCSNRRDEVSSYVTTVGEAIIPHLQNDGRILGSQTRRLEDPEEFIREWRAISQRSIGKSTPQEYINIPIVSGETDSVLSRTLVSWAACGP